MYLWSRPPPLGHTPQGLRDPTPESKGIILAPLRHKSHVSLMCWCVFLGEKVTEIAFFLGLRTGLSPPPGGRTTNSLRKGGSEPPLSFNTLLNSFFFRHHTPPQRYLGRAFEHLAATSVRARASREQESVRRFGLQQSPLPPSQLLPLCAADLPGFAGPDGTSRFLTFFNFLKT